MRTRAQVEVGITAAGGALQGSVLGYGLGMMNKSLEAQAATMPNKPPMAAQGSFSGPPKVLALNLAVFSAVQGGLTLAIKKYRAEHRHHGRNLVDHCAFLLCVCERSLRARNVGCEC